MKRSIAVWAAALIGIFGGVVIFKSVFHVSFGGIEIGPADPLRWWGGLALMSAGMIFLIWLYVAVVARRFRIETQTGSKG
ncbi:MAG: hypothetical protein WC943_11850 [Elusimicrobiota bacterium]|jgi:hypothetical protein